MILRNRESIKSIFFVDKSVGIFVAVVNDRPNTVADKKWSPGLRQSDVKDHLFWKCIRPYFEPL